MSACTWLLLEILSSWGVSKASSMCLGRFGKRPGQVSPIRCTIRWAQVVGELLMLALKARGEGR